jgi:SAM-dependent methyltransferase
MTLSQHLFFRRDTCRSCFAQLSDEIVAFESMPVAGAYVSPQDPLPDPASSLTVLRCSECGLLQLREVLAPSFYSQYSFMSGVAGGYSDYLKQLASGISECYGQGTRVLEVGCSDGTLLKLLNERGFFVTGFEPANAPAAAALNKGLTVVNDFLHADSAVRSGFEPADVIVIRHVLEHIDDFLPIFEGIDRLATPDATLLIEVPDLSSTIERSMYSNVYHIHSCYFDVETLSALLERHGWKPTGAITVNTFGGSLLLWAQRKDAKAAARSLPRLTFDELACKAANGATRAELRKFGSDWKLAAQAVRDFFDRLRDGKARVAGYGAAERTTSLMGAAALDASHISVVYDRNPNLVGRALPGSRIPIRYPDEMPELHPEYLVIFAQSFESEIVAQQHAFRSAGGKFISIRSGRPEVLA